MTWTLQSDEAITDDRGHHAFTTLLSTEPGWLCAYRHGTGHVSHDGRIRVTQRDRAGEWRLLATIESPDEALPDLRDPKLCRTGDRVILIATATRREPQAGAQAYTWVMGSDPASWAAPSPSLPSGLWGWGVAGLGDGFVISAHSQRGMGGETNGVTLWYGSGDRLGRPEPLIDGIQEPNETALAVHDDQLACLARMRYSRDGTPNGPAVLLRRAGAGGRWHQTAAPSFIGGPNLLFLRDGRLLASGRRLQPGTQTVIWEVSGDDWVERMILPASGQDSGYSCMVETAEGLAVSYYTQTETGCQVRLATVRCPTSDG